VVWNILSANLSYVPGNSTDVTKVLAVRLLRVRIPFAGEYAPPANLVEGNSDSSNSGEQVDVVKGAAFLNWQLQGQERLQCMDYVGWGLRLSQLPSANRASVDLKVLGN
jgi:hypothetical protein